MNIKCGQVDPKILYIVMCKGNISNCVSIASVGQQVRPNQRWHGVLETWEPRLTAGVDRYAL